MTERNGVAQQRGFGAAGSQGLSADPAKDEKPSSTVLIVGANGQIGYALADRYRRLLPPGKLLGLVTMPREALDVTDRDAVLSRLSEISPDVVINCAAFTDASEAERQRQKCWKTNVTGVRYLAEACQRIKAVLIHFSSDFVFGEDPEPLEKLKLLRTYRNAGMLDELPAGFHVAYREDSVTCPSGFYGYSKLASEHVLLEMGEAHPEFHYWVIRTAGLFESPWRYYRNFPSAILGRLRAGAEAVPVVADVYTNLCHASHLAAAVVWMVSQYRRSCREVPWPPRGIYHIANEGVTTWYQAALRIAEKSNFPMKRIVPISAQEYSQKFLRGRSAVQDAHYSGLHLGKYHNLPGAPTMQTWQLAIDLWCRESLRSSPSPAISGELAEMVRSSDCD